MTWTCRVCNQSFSNYGSYWSHVNFHPGKDVKGSNQKVKQSHQKFQGQHSSSLARKSVPSQISIVHQKRNSVTEHKRGEEDKRDMNLRVHTPSETDSVSISGHTTTSGTNDNTDDNDAIDDLYGVVIDDLPDLFQPHESAFVTEVEEHLVQVSNSNSLVSQTKPVHSTEVQLLYLMTKYNIPAKAFPQFMTWANQAKKQWIQF